MREIYHSEGDWVLVSANDYADWDSWITHTCETSAHRHPQDIAGAWIDATERRCYFCDLQPPDTLMGLWRLHNWDHIQKWEAGRCG